MDTSREDANHNLYGDLLLPIGKGFGADIASQHEDELDQACLAYAQELKEKGSPFSALDIGGASGTQAKRLAACGARVWLIDLVDRLSEVEKKALGSSAITFIPADVRDVFAKPWEGPPFSIVYAQRMLHYLPYDDALCLLKTIQTYSLPQQTHFFLSAAGLDTEFGQNYPARALPVSKRFAPLDDKIGQKHLMTAPLCLYTLDEFCGLLQASGLHLVKTWASPFGDPKVIARLP